jgi:hypothetical protein
MSEVACTKRSPRTALALFASSLPIPASATRALLAILADANVVLDAVAGSLTGTAAAAAALELINPSTLQMHTLNHLLAQTSPLSPATQATLVDSLLDRADEHAHSAVVVTIGSAPWVTSAAKATLHSAFPDIPFGTPAELADILAARIAQFTAQAGRKSTTSNDFERLTEILDIADQLAYTTRQLCRLRLDLALAVAARPGTGELLVDLAFDLDDTQLAAVFGQLVDPKAAQSLIRHRAEYAAYLFDHPFRDQVFAMLLKDAGDYYTSRAFRYMLNAKLITHELIATLPVEFAATSSTSLSAVLAYGAGLFADAPAALALYCDLVDQGGQLTIADIAQVARLTTTPLPTSPT